MVTKREDLTPKPNRERVREMTDRGFTKREIALALGISTQAVYQHLAKIKAEEEEPA